MSMARFLYYTLIKRIRVVRVLEYVDYRHAVVGKLLEEKMGWKYYGGHHHESTYTNFFQSFLLPTKFGIDKRKTENSALIRSGQMTREAALADLANAYPSDPEVVRYIPKKLGMTEAQFQEIVEAPVRSHDDFPNYLGVIRLLRVPIAWASKLGLVPRILFLKYARR